MLENSLQYYLQAFRSFNSTKSPTSSLAPIHTLYCVLLRLLLRPTMTWGATTEPIWWKTSHSQISGLWKGLFADQVFWPHFFFLPELLRQEFPSAPALWMPLQTLIPCECRALFAHAARGPVIGEEFIGSPKAKELKKQTPSRVGHRN